MPDLRLVRPALLALAATAWLPVQAEQFCNAQGCADFPQGAISFADTVVSYDPVIKNGDPSLPNRDSSRAIGVPDYTPAAPIDYVSLGDGGSITLRFDDNRLTGSGTSALDLWIFEVGPDVEDTFVEISKDGATWSAVGKVFGSTAGIDIDAFGFGVLDQFAYIRLTDDTAEGQQTGDSVGADIDSVGAISTVPSTPIPEPETWALMLGGLGVLGWAGRRRDRLTKG